MNIQDAPHNDPLPLFRDWLNSAKEQDNIFYCGMNIATVSARGMPTSRVVLLKEFDEQGFVFYTNYNSRKGDELGHNPNICANFWWPSFQRQIRIEGVVEKVSAEQSTDYFFTRPEGSQLAAIASDQSQPIESIEALENKYDAIVKEFENKDIKRPEHWGGYRIKPNYIEFWQGLQHRLHHRLIYKKTDNQWLTEYLQP